ncbi:MAG TPA: hypothetical protein VGI06_15965 [Acidimicrobiales bacterium]
MQLDLTRPLSHRLRNAGLAGAMVALAVVVAGPALGAGTPAPAAPSPLCPAGTTGANSARTTTSNGQVVAGYTISSTAAGFRYQLNSPGLLPVGDARVGTVAEFDVPFSRINVDQGPVIDAISSPVYPGDTAARLGSALGTFGAPGVPNDPVLAESNFPPAPGFAESAQFNQPAAGNGTGVATASSTATATGGTADAAVTSASLAKGPGGSSPVHTGSIETNATSDVGGACVDASAQSRTASIDIAGVIAIGGVVGYAAARSDGTKAVPQATLKVGAVTVAGLPAYIDGNGVHLASQQPVGGAVVQVVTSLLQKTLSSDHLSIKLLQPSTTVKDGQATADAGGIEIAVQQTLPAIGQPPAGTPPLPLYNIVEYGAAGVAVNATTAPAPGSETSSAGTGGASSGTGSTGGSALPVVTGGTSTGALPTGTGTDLGTTGASATGATTGGGQQLSSQPIAAPGRGSPAPIGWILVGILLAIVAVGPMMGYARWQLLEGRI